MSLVVFVKNAAGPTFGPYCIDDVVNLTAATISHLVDAAGSATKTASDPTLPTAKKKGDTY